MGKFYRKLNDQLVEFIENQPIFFTGTAPRDGRVNLSPKGMDTLRVLDDATVGYLDLTGSGAETAAHIRENGRLTLMFCSFNGNPLILRLYGRGELVRPGAPGWEALRARFPDYPGARQVVVQHVESVQTSCGFGVPLMGYEGQREELLRWTEKKGEAGLRRYVAEKNRESIDGLPTGLGEPD